MPLRGTSSGSNPAQPLMPAMCCARKRRHRGNVSDPCLWGNFGLGSGPCGYVRSTSATDIGNGTQTFHRGAAARLLQTPTGASALDVLAAAALVPLQARPARSRLYLLVALSPPSASPLPVPPTPPRGVTLGGFPLEPSGARTPDCY